jgi:hypothetical protein
VSRVTARGVMGWLAFALVIASAHAARPDPVPVQIDIDSRWGGLGPHQEGQFHIQYKNGAYVLNGRQLDGSAVRALVAALRAPALAEPDLGNLGIDRAWLEKQSVSPDTRLDFAAAAPNQKKLYHDRFSDLAAMRAVIATIYSSSHTDDYPGVSVSVAFDDRTVIAAASRSQHPFLVPWTVTRGAKEFVTYNAGISRAVAALLPRETVNRDRLSGAGLEAEIKEVFAVRLEDDWNALDAENRGGAALALLRQRYSVGAGEINSYHHPEYGVAWDDNRPHETNLHLLAHRRGLPANFSDAVVLLYRNNHTEGAAAFLAEAATYETLALSVPWLAAYIAGHPGVPVHLSYVHDASFGDKAMAVFAADMHRLGRDRLLAQIRPIRKQIALLIIGDRYAESYWLVLPDHRLVLWRYNGPSGLLQWKAAALRTKDCDAGYAAPYGGCAGAVVSPNGVLAN